MAAGAEVTIAVLCSVVATKGIVEIGWELGRLSLKALDRQFRSNRRKLAL